MKKYFRLGFFTIIAGILAGLASTSFLYLLNAATEIRIGHPQMIWGLPLAGIFIKFIYDRYGGESGRGNNLIIETIHNPESRVPLRMTPFVLLGTIITHLFGGSAGREGAAVQMGGSLSYNLSSLFKMTREEKKILLIAGTAAGFGSAMGTPLTGAFFGIEVIHVGKIRFHAWFEPLLASFVAYEVARFLKAPHTLYPQVTHIEYNVQMFMAVIILGLFSGGLAFAFSKTTHFFEKKLKAFFSKWLTPFVGGCLILIFYRIENSYQYVGLGIDVIQKSFITPAHWTLPLWKGFLTALTVSSGFKGGEFVPLVFMGTSLGSALSYYFSVNTQTLAALGFAAIFAGAANTPLTCIVMTMEIFGPQLGLYAVIVCFLSYYLSGHHGIYGAQKIIQNKFHYIKKMLSY